MNRRNVLGTTAAVLSVIIALLALIFGEGIYWRLHGSEATSSPVAEGTLPPKETEIVPTPEITPEPKDIIQQPQDLEVYPSDTARFTVVASSAVKSYTWQYLKPGATWKNVTASIFPSAKTGTLTFVAHESHNGFQYRCIVRFEDGTSEVSDPAKLTVKNY